MLHFIFLATLQGLWDLSSWPEIEPAPSGGEAQGPNQLLDCPQIPKKNVLKKVNSRGAFFFFQNEIYIECFKKTCFQSDPVHLPPNHVNEEIRLL